MSSMPTSLPLEVLPQQPVEHAVDPVTVPPVGPPPDALADEADPLRVAHRPLVEAVDLELQPVVVEVEEEMPVEHARSLVRNTTTAATASRSRARPPARYGSTSSWFASSTRKSTSSGRARRMRTLTGPARRRPRAPSGGAGPSRPRRRAGSTRARPPRRR